MFTPDRLHSSVRQRGLTLIELILAIMIIGIAVAGTLLVINNITRSSADPQLRKQALAVAEALLEEVRSMPFTTWDPDGYDAATQTGAVTEAIGPEAASATQAQTETRNGTVSPFDNVNDYHGLTLTGGATGLGGASGVVVPTGYTASVAVATDGSFGPSGSMVPTNEVLRITVTVTYSGGSVVLDGYRTRYHPTPTP